MNKAIIHIVKAINILKALRKAINVFKANMNLKKRFFVGPMPMELRGG
jgi:hypothetical protein